MYTFDQIQSDLDYIKSLNQINNAIKISSITLRMNTNALINTKNICTYLVPIDKIVGIIHSKNSNYITIQNTEKIKIRVFGNGIVYLVGEPDIQKIRNFLSYVLDKLKDTKYVSDINACNISNPLQTVTYNFNYELNFNAYLQKIYEVLLTDIIFCAKYDQLVHVALSFKYKMLQIFIFKKSVVFVGLNPNTLKYLNDAYNFVTNLTKHYTISKIDNDNAIVEDNNEDGYDYENNDCNENDIYTNIDISKMKLSI